MTKVAGDSEDHTVVFLQGRLDRSQAGPLWRDLGDLFQKAKPRRLLLDFQDITGIDTAGVALLLTLERHCRSEGIELSRRNLPESVAAFLDYLRQHSSGVPVKEAVPLTDALSRLGIWVRWQLSDAYAFIRFLGDALVAGPRELVKMRSWHLREILVQVQLAGVSAVPLLGTLSLLLGALMVFQGMKTVTNFGSPVYIADLVVTAVTREMAPLLTAIILAGRSGAAYAAEIGTMKLNEEVDALAALNFDTVGFLAIPRVLALMLAGPMLTMLSDAAGILGGVVTSRVAMGLPVVSFLHEAQKVLSPNDIYNGLIKGAVFGGFVGLIGCFRGMTAEQGPASVGKQTTSAVVTGIFVVVFLDTLFSYIFQMYNFQ